MGFPAILNTSINFKHSLLAIQKVGTNLRNLASEETYSVNDVQAIDYTIQLVNRLEKLHSLGYVHGNVCPEAIRFDEQD